MDEKTEKMKVVKTKGFRQVIVGGEVTVDLVEETRMSRVDAEKEWLKLIEEKAKKRGRS